MTRMDLPGVDPALSQALARAVNPRVRQLLREAAQFQHCDYRPTKAGPRVNQYQYAHTKSVEFRESSDPEGRACITSDFTVDLGRYQ